MSDEAKDELSRCIIVVIMLFGVQTLLSGVPAFLEWQKSGKLSVPHLAVGWGLVLVMSMLVLLRKNIPTMMAAVLIVCQLAFAGILAIHPTLIKEFSPDTLFPNPNNAMGGAVMLIAAFTLLTGGGTGRWVTSVFFAICSIAMPFLPDDFIKNDIGIDFTKDEVKTGAPAVAGTMPTPSIPGKTGTTTGTAAAKPPASNTSTISTGLYAVDLPSEWSQQAPPLSTKAGYIYMLGPIQNPDSFSVLIATEHAENEDIAKLAERRLAILKATTEGTMGYVMSIQGYGDRKRIYASSGQEVQEVVIVLKRKSLFILSCRAPRRVWQEHKANLDIIFKSFTPR